VYVCYCLLVRQTSVAFVYIVIVIGSAKEDSFTQHLSVDTHIHTHYVLMAIFPGEPGLAGCPLNSPSPFIPGLRILFGQA